MAVALMVTTKVASAQSRDTPHADQPAADAMTFWHALSPYRYVPLLVAVALMVTTKVASAQSRDTSHADQPAASSQAPSVQRARTKAWQKPTGAVPRPRRIRTAPTPAAPTKERSVLLVAGGVMITVASPFAIARSAFALADYLNCEGPEHYCREARNFAALVGSASVLLVAGGIWMIVYGSERVPVKASATLTPWLGRSTGGLVLDFRL